MLAHICRRVMLLDPGVAAKGEMVVRSSAREASTISTSSGVLTWDEVSTSLEEILS